MKLKVLVKFIDKHTGNLHNVGEVFEATEERLQEIMSVGNYVSVVEEEAPKKKRKRRKKVTEE